jgi:leader peptidase (prepilin peptidase)/N-methyltransferase
MPVPELFQVYPFMLYVVAALTGLAVGSFLNVVIHRLPKMMEREWKRDCRALLELEPEAKQEEPFDLVRPRSRCPQCGHAIRALENIPVVSWLALRGRCSACKAPISIRYPVIETIASVLTVVVVWHFGITLQSLAALALTWSLLALAAIDLDCQLLPDDITLPLLWLGLLCNLLGLFTNLQSAVLGAAAGYLLLWSVYVAFKLLTGKEGMGYGDFKLLAMLGAWLGWQMLPLIIIVSSVAGSLVAVALLLRGHERSRPIPFGPYLAVAGWIALLWGEQMTGAYLRWAVSA